MGKKVSILLLTLSFLILFTGCGSDQKDGDYVVYYLNTEGTKVVPQKIELTNIGGEAMVEELLQILATQPESSSMRQTIPSNVEVLGISTTSYQVTVDFSEEYYDLTPVEEVLTRAAIAKTLFQVTDFSYVSFTVESRPLMNSNGQVVGSMNADTFVENPGEQINSSQKTTLTLYFASADGTGLVKETRVVHYSSNISMEKLVMEQLLEGPKKSGSQGTIPTGTKLINVSVVDGICYISLDETFLNQNQEITEQVVLYSIVDSMTELETVGKVQISINGDTSGKCRFSYDLATMYEADPNIVVDEDTEKVESTE